MIIQKRELSLKIGALKSIVPKNSMVAAIQGILLRDGYLIATNHEITIKAKLEGAGGESFIIPQKAFDLIKNLPEGEMEIFSDKSHGVTIKAGSINNTFQSIDPKLFETGSFPGEGDSHNMALESGKLKLCMKNVLYAVSKTSTSQKMGALCIGYSGGFLNFVGTDGHVMAWGKLEYDGEEMELLIPRDAAEKILQLDFDGEVRIKWDSNSAVFVTEDYMIKTRLIEGPYMPYSRVFVDMPVHVTVNRKNLMDAANRAAMCIDANDRIPIRFQFDAGSVKVYLEARNAKYSETVPLEGKMEEPVLIAFDPRLFMETLKAFEAEKVNVRLASGRQPMLMDADGGNLQSLVLPVSI